MSDPKHIEIARAKVNLEIRVLRKREDGFHEMTTRMAPISLADDLEFYPAEKYSLECDSLGVPLDESNLVTKAVRLFERETGLDAKWKINLIKRVPHGAGLGGGSADAAAALRALNQLENSNITTVRMAELLSEIGSDIPFFAYNTVADCSGRGEIVVPVEGWDHEVTLLLLKPTFGVDTPAAYKAWLGAEIIPGIDYSTQTFDWGILVNDLEKPVFMKHRFLAEMKMWLLAQPETQGSMMSGSGSTFMAILDAKDGQTVLERARKELDPTLWGEVVNIVT